jgi:hypothetical protein
VRNGKRNRKWKHRKRIWKDENEVRSGKRNKKVEAVRIKFWQEYEKRKTGKESVKRKKKVE